MFTTDADIFAIVADLWKQNQNTLPPYAPNIAARAHQRAYYRIIRAWASRGFTLEQITQWDEGITFERDLSVWYFGTQTNVLHTIGIDEKIVSTFNREKELDECQALTIAGVAQNPLGTYGLPTVGTEDLGSIFGAFPPQCEQDNEMPLRF